MMMMNLSISKRTTTTTTCFALLSVLLVASLAIVVSSVNAKKNRMANTMPENNKGISRVLTGESKKLTYTRIYFAVTEAADFVRLFPNGGNFATYLEDFIFFLNTSASARSKVNAEFLIQGSSTTQKGAIFDSSSIEVVNDPDGVIVIVVRGFGNDFQVQLAGNRKLRFTPVDDPHYFFHGQCVATSGILEPPVVIEAFADDNGVDIVIPQPVITSQSCKLNMCLGGGGFSCIAIYSGSAFVFNFGKVVAINNSQNGNEEPVTFEAPPLPPPFPGTIIGGTGAFEGIEGSVTITTIAGTTGPLVNSQGPRIVTFTKTKPVGSIVQVITVKSNMPLPPGP